MDSDLKDFVKTQISSLSDADPEILADYILALITEAKPSNDNKNSLKEKLNEFFEDQTDVFIDRLFNHLDKKSGTKNASSNESYQIEGSDDDEEDGDRSFKHRRQKQDKDASRNEYNKRQLSDHEESNTNKMHRPYKPHRDDPTAIEASSGSSYSPYNNNNHSNRRGNRMNGHGRGGKRNYLSKPVCRDYNEKGYCVRGDLCPYDHGSDSIVVDEASTYNNNNRFGANSGNRMMPMVPGTQPFFNIPPNAFGSTEAYDPESGALMQNTMANFPMNLNNGMMPPIPDNILKSMMMIQQQQQQQQQQQGYTAPGGPMRKPHGTGHRNRGGYGNVNNDKMNNNNNNRLQQQQQNHRQQQTALVIDNIPQEMCDMTKINEYFKKFGTIINIKLQLQKAIVQFNTHAEAEAAYSSPDAIFDNRFVKVYWYKEGDEQPTAEPKPKIQNHWKPQPPPPSVTHNEPDPNEVAAKAAELAKLREEKQKKRQEQMKAVLDAQKQREQLLQEKIDEQKKLLAKLSDTSLTPAAKEELLATLKKIASDINISKTTTTPTPTTATATPATTNATVSVGNSNESPDQLKEKLAKLEAEAASLGISPDGSNRLSNYPSVRGGGSFYGYRGGWPRVARGGIKRSLDNRPTKILIKNIPENINKDELQQHFQQFGNLVSFDNNQNDFIAHYSQRYEAEKAMVIGSKLLAGQLTLSWYTNTTPVSQNTLDQESKV
ncbi:hypothetical protein BJ944DRAFT_238075 [Cunninghamella echinulata]|nr:hypothetical protein BJ944DRAFT_238075 [Cunninghamella echinulata]